jgi:periplasmic protein CpxP/Spy
MFRPWTQNLCPKPEPKETTMKTSIKTLLIAMTLAGGVAATAAYAMPPGGGPGSGACGYGAYGAGFGRGGMGGGIDSETHVDRLAYRLNLTPEQRTKVRAIVDKARPETRALRDKLFDNRQQLRTLVRQGNAKEADVRKLADVQGKLMADMIVQRSKLHNEINAVLTPEQREQFQQLGPRRGPGMGPGMGGPRGGWSGLPDDNAPEVNG